MSNHPPPPRATKEPSYLDAIIPLVVLITLIAGSVYLFGLGAIEGPTQVGLILSTMVAAIIILKNGHPWNEIAASGGRGIASIVSAIFILLAVGALIGTWNMAGTIPTLVHYGIQLLQPNWFYPATAMICAIISVGIGSSWTTAGTIGVGLVGIASLVGVSPVITAGAVISGAYFGDKTSPSFRDNTLECPVSRVPTSIRTSAPSFGHQIPAFIIALVVFTMLGLRVDIIDNVETATDLAKLDQLFWITPLNLNSPEYF